MARAKNRGYQQSFSPSYTIRRWRLGIYIRLSKEDLKKGKDDSNSVKNQELLCRGWFLPPNTYDCGSFVVNGTAVVGKEQNNPYNRWKSTQKGADLYENDI